MVRASLTIRYAATSTAAGSGAEVFGLDGTAGPPVSVTRSACWVERADQAAVVERGRPQVVDQAAYVGDDLLHVLRSATAMVPLAAAGSLSTSSRADSSW